MIHKLNGKIGYYNIADENVWKMVRKVHLEISRKAKESMEPRINHLISCNIM